MSNERVRVITEEQYKEYMKLKHNFGDTDKKVRRWKPKKGESYWYVADHGRCVLTTSSCSELDEERFEFSNVYQTDEKAQKELDRRLAEQELLDMCDWESGEWVCIRYDVGKKLFNFTSFGFLVYSPYRFASLTSCKRAIDTLGTEKLKLIFRID